MTSVRSTLKIVEPVLQALLASSMHLLYLLRRIARRVRRPGVRQSAGLGGGIDASRPHPTSTRNGTNREREVDAALITASILRSTDWTCARCGMSNGRHAECCCWCVSDRTPPRIRVTEAAGAFLSTAEGNDTRRRRRDYLEDHYADLSDALCWRYGDRS